MHGSLRKPVPPVVWEVLLASVLAGWRVLSLPSSRFWSDWLLLLCLFWIVTAHSWQTRAWPYVAGAWMGGLLVVYGWGQLPLTLAALGLGR